MRSADTAARGTRTNMITAIITAIRIWATYWRNAMRLPIGISPLSTRRLPNHRIATDDRLKMSMRIGISRANSRFTRTAVDVSSRLATSKRASSCSVRTNARMTRMPASVSRVTWLMRSMRTWRARKSGTARASSTPMTSAMIGRITTRMPASGTSWRRAMITPPMAMIGARIITLKPISTTIWTCWTSFVFRVISDGVPNRLSSAWENDWTARKMPPRTSRPKAMPTPALK